MKGTLIVAALIMTAGAAYSAEFSDLQAFTAADVITTAPALKAAAEVKRAEIVADVLVLEVKERAACSRDLKTRYAEVMGGLSEAYANRLLTGNEYHLAEAAVLYSQKSGCAAAGYALEKAVGVFGKRAGIVEYKGKGNTFAEVNPKHSEAVSAGSMECRPEIKVRYRNVIEDLSNAYANRLLTGNEYHLAEAAVLYSQKSGCAAVEYSLEKAGGFLKETVASR